MENIYWGYYVIVMALNCFNLLILRLIHLETAKKNLEEFDLYFTRTYGYVEAAAAVM